LSGEAAPPAKTSRCTLNFQNISIKVLVDAITKCTGKEISIDPNVLGTFTFVSPQPQTPAELYKAFVEFMDAKGYQMIEEEPAVKLRPKIEDAHDVE
jgi:type II secretory pathway component GspD/PulD (secretin)